MIRQDTSAGISLESIDRNASPRAILLVVGIPCLPRPIRTNLFRPSPTAEPTTSILTMLAGPLLAIQLFNDPNPQDMTILRDRGKLKKRGSLAEPRFANTRQIAE